MRISGRHKAISPMIATVLLIAFTVGVGGLVTTFLTSTTQTSTGITSNASESLILCSAALIDIPKDSVYCVNGYNLTGYWKFEEGSGTTAGDSSGNSITGTLGNATGGTAPTWGSGKFGNGLNFNGSQFVNMSTITLGSSQITMMAWFKELPDYDQQVILVYGQADTVGQFNLMTVHDQPFRVWLIAQNSTGSLRLESPNNAFSFNEWTHIAGTYKDNALKLYINGELKASGSIGYQVPNSEWFYIGMASKRTPHFNGTIDDVRLYKRALSASEIKQIYESGLTELFGNKSVVKFQLKNNGQYNLRKDFGFALTTSSASNTTTIALSNDLDVGNVQLVTLANLTMSSLSVGSVQKMYITSMTCPNVQLSVRDLGMDC